MLDDRLPWHVFEYVGFSALTAAPSISYNHSSTVFCLKIPCIIIVSSTKTVGKDTRILKPHSNFLKTDNLWWDFYNKYADSVRLGVNKMIHTFSWALYGQRL
jgi:hypothetical protein